MRGFRKKEKKKLPQNKPSRDESSLPRCNISSMAGSAAHGCFVNCHGLRRKNNNKNHVQHNRGQNVRIALLMNCVKAAMFQIIKHYFMRWEHKFDKFKSRAYLIFC